MVGRWAVAALFVFVVSAVAHPAAAAQSPIDKKYSDPAIAALLGASTGQEHAVCNGRGREHDYTNGNIYWTADTGAHEVHGPILSLYTTDSRLSGPCGAAGFPKSDVKPFADGPNWSGGSRSRFQHVEIDTSNRGTFFVQGKVLTKYRKIVDTPLNPGPPTNNFFSTANVGHQEFAGPESGFPLWIYQYGVIPHVKTHELHGAILGRFQALGGEGFFGPPLSDELNTPCNATTGGRFNRFAHAAIIWSPSTQPGHEIHDEEPGGLKIYSKWNATGRDCGPLGIPTTNVTATTGGNYANFTKGEAIYASGSGTHEVHGKVLDKWGTYNWELGFMGFPTSDVIQGPNGGYFSHFDGGSIYWDGTSTFANDVDDAHDTKYRQLGGPSGLLGYPTFDTGTFSDGFLFSGHDGRNTPFEHGKIVSNYWTTPIYMTGNILSKWLSESGTSAANEEHQETGYPVGDPFSTGGGGVFQQFKPEPGHDFPNGPKGSFLIINPHETHRPVYKIDGQLLECYASGPPGTQGAYWDSPMGFPTSDEIDDPGHGETAFFENGPHGQTGVVGQITIDGSCQYSSTGS